MEKKLKDYLHLYLGSEILWEFSDGSGGGTDVMTEYHLNEVRIGSIKVKPILRLVSGMKKEEATYLAELYSRWAWRKEFEVKSLDCTDKSAFITIYYVLEGGPHGIGDGEYSEQLVISEGSIWARGSVERNEYKIVLESHEMHRYLLSKHFDLFGLCESGLAIDSTTLQTPTP